MEHNQIQMLNQPLTITSERANKERKKEREWVVSAAKAHEVITGPNEDSILQPKQTEFLNQYARMFWS